MLKDTNAKKSSKKSPKHGKEFVQINLKVPVEVKDYLTIAATKASIKNKCYISIAQYLCQIVRKDMEINKY